jgi:hypothetical protein
MLLESKKYKAVILRFLHPKELVNLKKGNDGGEGR